MIDTLDPKGIRFEAVRDTSRLIGECDSNPGKWTRA